MAVNIAGYNRPFGLRPFRNLAGGVNPIARRVAITSATHCLLAGDPVRIETEGTVKRFATAATLAEENPFGVVVGVYNSNKRPLTHNTGGPFLNQGENGYVDVVPFTPNQTFLVALGQLVSASTKKLDYIGTRVAFGISSISEPTSNAANATLMGVSMFCVNETTVAPVFTMGATVSAAEYNAYRKYPGQVIGIPAGGVDVGENRFLNELTDDTISLVEVVVDGIFNNTLSTRLPL